jgi:hypothetical protein
MSANHVPCGTKWPEGSDVDYPCRDGVSDYFTDTYTETVQVFPGSYAESVGFKYNSWIYISLTRDIPSSDYNQLCSYTILVQEQSCTNGTIGVNAGSAPPQCAPYASVSLPYVANWEANDQATERRLRVTIPPHTAELHVFINNSDWTTYVYGNAHFFGGDYYYTCYDSYSSNSAGVYEVDVHCFNPPVGDFFLYFYTYSSGYYLQGNVSISLKTCPSGWGGFNCSYRSVNLTDLTSYSNDSTIVPGEGGSSSYSTFSDGFQYFFYEFPAGFVVCECNGAW